MTVEHADGYVLLGEQQITQSLTLSALVTA